MISDFTIGHSGHLYSLQGGDVYALRAGTAQHLPVNLRGVEWHKLTSPDGLDGSIVKIGAAGSGLVYALTDDGRLWQYGQGTQTYIGKPGVWTEIEGIAGALPLPIKSTPNLVHTYRATGAGFSEPFELPDGHYALGVTSTVTVERAVGKRWQLVLLDERNRFSVLQGQIRVGTGPDYSGMVAIYQEANR